jgi:small subunit ribosomal protein S4
MARDMTPVLKRCRSLGLDPVFMGLDKKSNRTSSRAGKKLSEYGIQLREKQKAKFIYGVLEKPFRNNFANAKKIRNGTAGENLLILLELRLDNVMYRLGYGRTRKESRQIVDHKHVTVNGKTVNIPSYKVKVGDVIEVKERYKTTQRYKDILEATGSKLVPAWLEANHENLSGVVKEIPTRDQIDAPVDEMLIVELYSK